MSFPPEALDRDTRFSRDKRPYKTHLDLWFPQGAGASRDRPGCSTSTRPSRNGSRLYWQSSDR